MGLEVKRGGNTSSSRCVYSSNSINYITNTSQSNFLATKSELSNSENSKKIIFFSKFSSKKSQITLFIILGLIILLLILGYLYFTQIKTESLIPTQTFSEDSKPISVFVDQCLFDAGLKAVMLISVQGGSISLNQRNIQTEFSKVVYGLQLNEEKNGEKDEKKKQKQTLVKTLPTKQEMQAEIESYINTILPECIGNFSKFKKDISAGELKSKVNIADDKVIVILDFPVAVNTIKIDKFQTIIPLRLGHLHTIAEKIIDDQLAAGIYINLDKLHEYDVKVDLSPHDDTTMIFLISDVKNAKVIGSSNKNNGNNDGNSKNDYSNSNQNQQPDTDLLFMTAVQFPKNNAPKIAIDDEFVIKDGVSFMTKAIIDDEDIAAVKLSDDTALFGIEQDGTISFIPEIPGEYVVTITAQDKEGLITTKNIKFLVVK